MDLKLIDALVERILDDLEQRYGVDDAWLLYCRGHEAIRRWPSEAPGVPPWTERVAVARLHAAIQRRAAARRALAA